MKSAAYSFVHSENPLCLGVFVLNYPVRSCTVSTFVLLLCEEKSEQMAPVQLSDQQRSLARLPADRRIFLEGIAGTGKTTAAVARLEHLLRSGVPGQRHPARPAPADARRALRGAPAQGDDACGRRGHDGHHGRPGAADDRAVLAAGRSAGRLRAPRAPARLPDPRDGTVFHGPGRAADAGGRARSTSIRVERNRLYSQILDNLNKAAVVGFEADELGPRLKAAWLGESAQLRVYDEGQEAAPASASTASNTTSWTSRSSTRCSPGTCGRCAPCREYLLARYRHLIVDNTEEDTPVSHDILAEWLPHASSALVVYDAGGGYRRFLGADPQSAYRLKALCEEQVAFDRLVRDVARRAGVGGQLAPCAAAPAESRRTRSGHGAAGPSPVLAEELDFDAPRRAAAPGRRAARGAGASRAGGGAGR